ncbi:uncharacterized protein BDR25DRAFT_308192 [Lindgomyces ingoldianus]|uniref:Uncharacterized protein n=1 Tax=Lindgomyces ingoldianus TaxID=673940 RepID=A0ACB6Q763_9PLEO|nr:uncharacterized protein BDR25DRAFT_308192 [Lindgomyces ingoldianus]KAF2462679.1 hypothetical protein BDR25DRAFT_308192 [Lindgomyces ingoldianus]
MSAPSLPSSRAFITTLLNSLPALPPLSASATNTAAPTNPLNSVPESARKQLLTLHVLFPNELLPALDLLDRRLVTRFLIRGKPMGVGTGDTKGTMAAGKDAEGKSVLRGGQGDVARSTSDAMAEVEVEADETLAPHSHNLYAAMRATGQMENNPDMEMLDSSSPSSATLAHAEDGVHVPRILEQDADAALPKDTNAGAREVVVDTVYYVRSAQQKSSRYSSSYDSTTSYEVRLTAWNCSCPAFAFAAFPSLHPEPPIPQANAGEPQPRHTDLDLRVSHDKLRKEDEDQWSSGGLSLGDGMPPVCKHLLACVLVERCSLFSSFVENKDVGVEEAAGWAAGWGD